MSYEQEHLDKALAMVTFPHNDALRLDWTPR